MDSYVRGEVRCPRGSSRWLVCWLLPDLKARVTMASLLMLDASGFVLS